MSDRYRPWFSALTGRVSRAAPAALRWHLRRLLFAVARPRWTLPSGVRIRIDGIWDWTVYDEIFLRGAYDAAIRRALAQRAPGRPLRVLDLGSNVGFAILRVVDLLRQAGGDAGAGLDAVLVEADAAAVAEARRRLLDDNRLAGAVTLVHGLAGRRSGAARLSREPSHLLPSLHRAGAADGTAVAYVDLEALTARFDGIDLLKCDIEGAELALLEHYPALLRRTRVACLELHHDLTDTARCTQLLASAGLIAHAETSVEPVSSIYTAWRDQ